MNPNVYKQHLNLLVVFEDDDDLDTQWDSLVAMSKDYPSLVTRYGRNNFDRVEGDGISFIEGAYAFFAYRDENIRTASEDVINTIQDYGLYARDIIPVEG